MKKPKLPKKINGQRQLTRNVKTAKGRKLSSTLWLHRQLNDPYVLAAKQEGYRSRASYKLVEIQTKFRLFKPGQRIVDLGSAPGGWSQVALQAINQSGKTGEVYAIDLLEMQPIPGVQAIQGDFSDETTRKNLKSLFEGPIDNVISDIAPSTCGNPSIDHLRSVALCEQALFFALDVLKPGGNFVAKIFQGAEEPGFFNLLRLHFASVKRFKPEASRPGSPEIYLVAQNKKANVDSGHAHTE